MTWSGDDGVGDRARPARRDVLAETSAAVLFANDSTLTDSKASVERSWTQWAHDHGVPSDRLGDTHGMPSRQVIARIAPELDLETAAKAFRKLEMDDLRDVTALSGAREALSAVRGHAAIVTSAGLELLEARLDAAGLPTPDVVVTADDVSEGKPSPMPYLEAARRLGVDPARCLVVEDAVAGVRSGKAAGAAVLALVTTTPAELLGEADLVADDLSEVELRVVDGGVRVRTTRTRGGDRRTGRGA